MAARWPSGRVFGLTLSDDSEPTHRRDRLPQNRLDVTGQEADRLVIILDRDLILVRPPSEALEDIKSVARGGVCILALAVQPCREREQREIIHREAGAGERRSKAV